MKSNVVLVKFLIILALAYSDDDQDLYKILGINKRATQKEIKQAYKNLAKEWHPDKNKDPSANEKFMKINEAYETLSDTEKRSEYDNFGRTSAQSNRGQDNWNMHGSVFNGFPFHFRNFQQMDTAKHRLNLWGYENKVLPDSYTKPTIIYAFTEFCFQCLQVVPVWEQMVQDLEKIGMGIGTLNANMESHLSHKLRLSSVPAILGVVNGKVRWFSKPFTVQYMRDFVRDLVPSNLIAEVNEKNVKEFLNGWTDNRVRMLFFDTRKQPCLRYLLTAFAFRDRVCPGYVHASRVPAKLLSDYKIAFNQENLLIFKENTGSPAAQISMHSISRNTMNEVIEGNQYLILPRLSSQAMFDHLCPPQSSINSKRLCVLLLTKNVPQHDPFRESFRKHAQEQSGLGDRVRFAYVYEDAQSDFVDSLTSGKGVTNDSLGTLKVAIVWRKKGKALQYDYLQDGWYASGKELEQSRNNLIHMVDWLLEGSDVLPFSIELSNDLIDEHALHFLGRMMQKLVDSYDWLWDKIVSYDDVTIVALVTALIVILFVYLLSRTIMSNDDDAREGRASQRRSQRTTTNSPPRRSGDQANSSLRTVERQRFDFVQLNEQHYNHLVLDAPQRSISLILLAEERRKDGLVQELCSIVGRFRSSPVNAYAWLNLDANRSWYRHLVQSTLDLSRDRVNSLLQKGHGTVLVVNGHRNYYWLFDGRRSGEARAMSGDFLGLENSDSEEVDAGDEDGGLLSGLDDWLGRLQEGAVSKFKVSEWPPFSSDR